MSDLNIHKKVKIQVEPKSILGENLISLPFLKYQGIEYGTTFSSAALSRHANLRGQTRRNWREICNGRDLREPPSGFPLPGRPGQLRAGFRCYARVWLDLIGLASRRVWFGLAWFGQDCLRASLRAGLPLPARIWQLSANLG